MSDRASAANYDDDMTRAKSAGIDAFVLHIGTDDFTDQQLDNARKSSAKNRRKVFISFDFNWCNTWHASEVRVKIKQYGSQPAQLKVGNNGDEVFVSSFRDDGLDVSAVQSAAGMSLFLAPNSQSSYLGAVDRVLNWMAWPNNGDSKAPTTRVTLTYNYE